MTRLRSMKAFTLIELIVVVIIIGILAAVAAVAYNQFIGNAQKSAAQADAASVTKALNAGAAANTTANGDSALFTKNLANPAAVSSTTGVAVARLLKTNSPAVVLDTATIGTFASGSVFYVGDANHNCTVTFTPSNSVPIATVSACN